MKNRFKTSTLIRLWFVYQFGSTVWRFGEKRMKYRNRKYFDYKEFLYNRKERLLELNIGKEVFSKMTIIEILSTKV